MYNILLPTTYIIYKSYNNSHYYPTMSYYEYIYSFCKWEKRVSKAYMSPDTLNVSRQLSISLKCQSNTLNELALLRTRYGSVMVVEGNLSATLQLTQRNVSLFDN